MLLFKEEHVKPIQRGEKTQTRRIWSENYNKPKQWAIHLAKTKMLSKDFFARLLILKEPYQERLGDITPEDALKEGGYTVEEFKGLWDRINRKHGGWDPELMVWVVNFECVPNMDVEPGDIVRMSPECSEYRVHGNKNWVVESEPWRIGCSELVKLEGFSGGFSTDFLELVENKNAGCEEALPLE